VTLGACLACLALTSVSPSAYQNPSDDDWTWLDDNRMAALDILMPLADQEAAVVTFRSYRVLYQDAVEEYFRIVEPSIDTFVAVLVLPIGQSVQDQLLKAHMEDPAGVLPTLLDRVRLRTVALEGSSCPAIREQLKVLDTLQFRTPDRRVLTIHPPIYSFAMRFIGGSLVAEYQDEGHPLVRWALNTRTALLECAHAR